MSDTTSRNMNLGMDGKLNISSKHSVQIKQQKCQPAARDTPDLIKTECVPDRGLARQKRKRKNIFYWKDKPDGKLNISPKHCVQIKQQKCQPAARDTPDLIKTECVPDRGLARQKRKRKNIFYWKDKPDKAMTAEKLVSTPDGKWIKGWNLLTGWKNKKNKMCQPAARDTPDLIKTECVPDRGLARPKKLTEQKKYKHKNSNGKRTTFCRKIDSHRKTTDLNQDGNRGDTFRKMDKTDKMKKKKSNNKSHDKRNSVSIALLILILFSKSNPREENQSPSINLKGQVTGLADFLILEDTKVTKLHGSPVVGRQVGTTYTSQLNTEMDGWRSQCFQMECHRIYRQMKLQFLSNKRRNRRMKMTNGNGSLRRNISVNIGIWGQEPGKGKKLK